MNAESMQARKLAEQAFAEMPVLTAKESSLLVLGVGSGALIERILQEYEHPPRESPSRDIQDIFIDSEWNPSLAIPIWVFETDAHQIARAEETYNWANAVASRQLRFITGSNALDILEDEFIYPLNRVPTNWVISPDASVDRETLQKILDRVSRSKTRRGQASTRLNESCGARYHDMTSAASWRGRYAVGKRLKILVLGVPFGGFVGESTRLFARALERLGHEILFVSEGSSFQSIAPLGIQRAIDDFSPHLIVWTNHTRSYLDTMNVNTKGIPFCCWIQDPPVFNLLKSEREIERRSELDFYISAARNWTEELESLGYGDVPAIKVPTDPHIFSMNPTSEYDSVLPECDLSYTATVPGDSVQELFAEENARPDAPLQTRVNLCVYREVLERLATGGKTFQPDDYRRLVHDFLRREKPGWLEENPDSDAQIDALAYSLENHAGRVAFRGAPLVWLVEAGHDAAVFGTGWDRHPVLRSRFHGWIPYGRPMASMLCKSKIHVCVHNVWTLTMKVLDCLATGTFPLVRWVEPDRESGPITDWYKEDRDIVLFRTREELLDKTRYYLSHPEERRRIAMRGREITLQHFTYDRMAAEIVQFIRNRLTA